MKKDLYYKNNYVKEVKYKHFDKNNLIKGNSINQKYFLIIYSPDCEICNNHSSLFTELALIYKNFNFYSINCYDIKNKNDILCVNLNISVYPTLLYFKNNKLNKFKKNITYSTLENFLIFN